MTLVCEPDLDMVKTNRLAEHNGSKVISFNSYRVNTHTEADQLHYLDRRVIDKN